MKKFSLLALIILSSLFSLMPVHAASDTTDRVVRNILTNIVWNQEYQRIEIHRIIVQKIKNQITAAYPNVEVFYDVFDKKDPTQEEVFEYIQKYEYDSVYKSDIIFGHRVDLYLDLTKKQISQQELDNYIVKAKFDVERDFNSPPTFDKVSELGETTNFNAIYIVVIVLLMIFAVYLVKNRYR